MNIRVLPVGQSTFDQSRAMSRREPHPKDDPGYWSWQMAAVAERRDRESFMRIYDHFAPRVRLYLRGLGSPESEAEEVAQEALLRLWQRAERFDATRGSVSTWLFRIARNLHIDRARREPSWLSIGDEWIDEDVEHGNSTERHLEQRDLAARIDLLPAVQARLLRMSYFEAKSHQEIADELAMPLGTVKSHVRRAFLKLQSGLKDTP
ncbi:MAG: sigma-70 family RNA polymerase sigma factor [Dokdonella sp.]|uniref:sigma-70 family RNA polymerase sigma factor n=1 Tax=Dokdonella sp. TaxID=2291710 RepID=UPI003F7F7E9F